MLTEFWNHKGWVVLVPLFIAAVAFYAWIGIGVEARAMERHGIETQATILELHRTVRPAPVTGIDGTTVPRFSFNYAATVMFSSGAALDGTLQVHEVKHFIDQDYFEAQKVGDRVWVRYLPSNPDRIELKPGGTRTNSNAAGWVALGMLASAALLGWLLWSHAAKVHRFKTLGVATEATVTDITLQSGTTILDLTLPDGRRVKALPVRVPEGHFAPGARLTVLTEPGNATQVMIPPTP